MAVKLRLRRMGKKRQPIYKLVAADERAPRDGRFIEALGSYNPKANPSTVEIDQERALYWLGVGAQPTITVKNLLSGAGILYKNELLKSGKSEAEVNAAMDEWSKKKEAKTNAAKSKADKEKAEKAKAKAEAAKKAEEEAAAKEAAEKAAAEAESTDAVEENSDKEDKED